MDVQALLPAAERVTATVRFLLLETGEVRVELPDSRGRWHRYTVAANGRVVELRREDRAEPYTVQPDWAPGLWRCDCPSWRFGGGKCKHVDAAKLLRSIHGLRP